MPLRLPNLAGGASKGNVDRTIKNHPNSLSNVIENNFAKSTATNKVCPVCASRHKPGDHSMKGSEYLQGTKGAPYY